MVKYYKRFYSWVRLQLVPKYLDTLFYVWCYYGQISTLLVLLSSESHAVSEKLILCKMVTISELELEWSLVQFELHLELGFFLIFELSGVWFFFQIILCTLDFVCWLTADFDQVPNTWKIFFYTNGLSCVCEARFIGLASGPQRQTTCLPVRGCFLGLVCLCVVVWVLFSIFSIFCITSFGDCTRSQHQEGVKKLPNSPL